MSESNHSTKKPTVTRTSRPEFRQSTTNKPIINPKSKPSTESRKPTFDNMVLLVHGFVNQQSNNQIPLDIKIIIGKYYYIQAPYAHYQKHAVPAVTWDDSILFRFTKHTDQKKAYLLLDHEILNPSYLDRMITMDNCVNIDLTITTTQPIVVAPSTNISDKKQQPVPKTISLGVISTLPDGPTLEADELMAGFDPVKKKSTWGNKLYELDYIRTYMLSCIRSGKTFNRYISTPGFRHKASDRQQPVHFGDKITIKFFKLDYARFGVTHYYNGKLIKRSKQSQLGEPEPKYEKFDLRNVDKFYIWIYLRDNIYLNHYAEIAIKFTVKPITLFERELRVFYTNNPYGPKGRYWDVDVNKPYEFAPGNWFINNDTV